MLSTCNGSPAVITVKPMNAQPSTNTEGDISVQPLSVTSTLNDEPASCAYETGSCWLVAPGDHVTVLVPLVAVIHLRHEHAHIVGARIRLFGVMVGSNGHCAIVAVPEAMKRSVESAFMLVVSR